MTTPILQEPAMDLGPAVARLAVLLRHQHLVVLTGAGISTESGIPDYRGPGTMRRARNPMKFQAFVADPANRARYWARAHAGWARVAGAQPNAAHEALARLEAAGRVRGLITQNVDRLHHRAGSKQIIELHGSLHDVVCLACGAHESRSALQERLARVNPHTVRATEIAPDGDAEIGADAEARFRVVGCLACGGSLKPDVVFFGENVPRERVETAYAWVDEADALLVIGSSLTVFSGYRFVKRAQSAGKPVGIVNLGPTRGDALADVKVEGRAGEVVPALVSQLL